MQTWYSSSENIAKQELGTLKIWHQWHKTKAASKPELAEKKQEQIYEHLFIFDASLQTKCYKQTRKVNASINKAIHTIIM